MYKGLRTAGQPRLTMVERRRRGLQIAAVALIAVAGVLLVSLSSPRAAGNFVPTISFETSTTRATSHPDLRITVDNSQSSEQIKSVQIDMPDGFMGSLAAADKCPKATVESQGTCPASSRIGTIASWAKIDNSDAKLDGFVYLTEALTANEATDPAGLLIEVPAVVGGVDLGVVRVTGRVQVRYDSGVTMPVATGGVGPIRGVRTIVDNIPTSHTDNSSDASGRTVTFSLKKMVVDLRSNQSGTYQPLFTNPSKCSTSTFAASLGGWDGASENVSQNYTVDGCSTVVFGPTGPTSFEFTPSSTTAGAKIDLDTTITLPENSASMSSVDVVMPRFIAANTAAFGDTANDQCPVETMVLQPSYTVFYPKSAGYPCPAQARVGTVEIETPMLPQPLKGHVYLIEKAPIPYIGVYADETTDGGTNDNPSGVVVSMVGDTSASYQFDQNCDVLNFPPSGECPGGIKVSFRGLPDAPVSKVTMSLGVSGRLDSLSNPLDRELLKIASAADSSCVPGGDFVGDFRSNAGPTIRAGAVDEMLTSGCNASPISFDSGPVGQVTTDSTPTFGFTAVGSQCAIDSVSAYAGCSSPFTSSTLSPGIHRFWVSDGSSEHERAFVVRPAPAVDPAPSVSIDSGPAHNSTTSDTTPTWSFGSSENVTFQCSIDDGAFLPCGTGTSGTFTVAAADEFLPGSAHSFSVRAQDSAGNLSGELTNDFDVSLPFSPTLDVDLTTNVARSHPDMDITITNPSEQDFEDITIKMPDGFMGGLQGVQTLCPVAAANAGNCPAGSQVGTIDTEAVVDESIIRISGKVYLTDKLQAGDPAGLSIKVPAVIQSINMGNIVVPARLVMRGQAQGIDSMVIGAPRLIQPDTAIDPWDATTHFTMRKLVIKLRTNGAAAQPLLTNPSSCAGGEFRAEFKAYDSGDTASVNKPFSVAGCEALAFGPTLTSAISRLDGTSVNEDDYQPVDFTANLSADPAQAGIKEASVLLPKPLTMDPVKLPPVCEDNNRPIEEVVCGPETVVGQATATSPLLRADDLPLSGPVYLLRGRGPDGSVTALPRLLVHLDGRISVKIVGRTSFENGTQIRTIFSNLPDAPINTFTMRVASVLRTMKAPCDLAEQYGTTMTGRLTGHNGKSTDVASTLQLDCSAAHGIATRLSFKKRGKRSSLLFGLQKKGLQPNMNRIRLQFGRGMTVNPHTLFRRLLIKINGRRLSSKSVRKYVMLKGRDTLTFRIGRKRYQRVEFLFKTGSLNVQRNLRKPILKYWVSPGKCGAKDTAIVNLQTRTRSFSSASVNTPSSCLK